METCRTCRFLDVRSNSAGKRIPRKGSVYPCIVEVVPQPLPSCMRTMFFKGDDWLPSRSWMEPDEGAGCQFHKPLVEKAP